MTKTVISCQQRVRQGCLEVMQMRETFTTVCLIHSGPQHTQPERKAQWSSSTPRGEKELHLPSRARASSGETPTAGRIRPLNFFRQVSRAFDEHLRGI